MEFVKCEKKDQVLVVTLNRPERLNAIGIQVRQELAEAWKMLAEDAELRVGVITGAGRAFCAGADIKEMTDRKDPDFTSARELHPFNPRVQPKPVVAAVNGLAFGAGFDILAMGSDICIAAESAVFGMPEVSHGLFALGTPFVIQRIPVNIIMEILLMGNRITAQRAYEIGVVNRVAPDEQLMPEALKAAERIAEHSPVSVRLIRQNVLKAVELSETAHIVENVLRKEAYSSKESAQGIKAFSQKGREASEGRKT